MKSVRSHLPKELPEHFTDLVMMHSPRAISDEVEFQNVHEIMDRMTSTPNLTEDQMAYLDTLAVLFEAYEKEHPPFKDKVRSGLEMLEFMMEQNDMNASDLGRLLGDRSLGGRVLKGERSLSKAHIRKLCERFKVGPDLFWDFL